MASSPTEQKLVAIAEAYDLALDGLACADLDAVQTHLDRVDALHAQLRRIEQHDLVPQDLITRIEVGHSELCGLIGSALSTSKTTIQRSMDGRRALRGYGSRSAAAAHRKDLQV